jgi:peptide/nickel transport system permease protein
MINLSEKWKEFRTSMNPRVKEWKFMMRRIRETPLSLVGMVIVFFFVAVAILAPVLAPPQSVDPFQIPRDVEISKLTPNPTPPTLRHIFGTTAEQYDLYYGCIWGTITAFRIGFFVVAVSLVVGLLVGTLAAYYGGLLDEALMRFTDIIIAFPGLILAMALVIAFPPVVPLNLSLVFAVIFLLGSFIFLAFRPDRRLLLAFQLLLVLSIVSIFYYPLTMSIELTNLDKVLISIILVGWPGYTRVIRGEVLRVKNEDYIEAARASGSSDFRVIVKHILPNSIYPIVIMATLDIGSVVLTAAALSFLGLGAPINYADWGQIISRSRPWISQPSLLVANFHTFFIPGLFIAFFVMGWNLLGDALRDVLDPMLRRK